jgi:uncharacterized protein (TIGR02001 family)
MNHEKEGSCPMKSAYTLIAVVLLAATFPVCSQAATPSKNHSGLSQYFSLSGNATVMSNYLLNAASQTGNGPAAQLNINVRNKQTGLFAGVIGTNTKLPDDSSNNAYLEVDYYLGIGKEFSHHLGFDLTAFSYTYPKADGLSYAEYTAQAHWRFLKVTIGYSNNVFDTKTSGTSYQAGVSFNFPEKYTSSIRGLNLHGYVGRYALQDAAGGNYNYSELGMSKSYDQYTFSLNWLTTWGNAALDALSIYGNHVVASVSVHF